MQHEPLIDEMSSSLKEWQSIKRKSFVDNDHNSIFFYSDKRYFKYPEIAILLKIAWYPKVIHIQYGRKLKLF